MGLSIVALMDERFEVHATKAVGVSVLYDGTPVAYEAAPETHWLNFSTL